MLLFCYLYYSTSTFKSAIDLNKKKIKTRLLASPTWWIIPSNN